MGTMRVMLHRLLLAAALLIAAAPARAQTSHYDPQYLIDRWETDEGLPENSATAMVQTPQGYLVFGTFGGLVQFDGVQFRSAAQAASPALPHAGVVNIHLDGGGRLWVSTYRGAGLLEGQTWKPFAASDGWRGDFVRSFAERENGDLLLTMFNGVVQEHRGGRFHPLTPPGNSKSGYIGQVDDAGRWWVAQDAFAGWWDGSAWHAAVATTPGANVGCGRAADGGVWLLVDRRLSKHRGGREVLHCDLPEDPGGFWSMMEDSQGHVWICTHDRGVCRVTIEHAGASSQATATLRRWRAGAGLGADGVRFVFEDREGTHWIGTSGGGLSRFRSRRFQHVTAAQGLPRRVVTSVHPDGAGALIATYGGGLLKWDGTSVSAVPVPDWPGGSEIYVQSVLKDRAGITWIGTWGGLRRADGVGSMTVPTTPGTNILALFEDSRGRIWFSGGGSVACFADGAFHACAAAEDVNLYGTFCFAQDSSGAIWQTNGTTVSRMQKDRFQLVRDEQGAPIQGISGLKADRDGAMWILGHEGLLRWRGGRLGRVQTAAPLQMCQSMLEDDRGCVWMATMKGIVRCRLADLHAAADGGRPLIDFAVFDKSDGLPSLDFSSGRQPLGGRDERGRLWFATQKGAVVTDPSRLRLNAVVPPVVVAEVTYVTGAGTAGRDAAASGAGDDGRQRLAAPFAAPVSLPAGSRRLEFRYAGLSLAAPQKVRFEVMLDGLDRAWLDMGNQRSAYYHDLPPGDYTFRVRAANNDGVWNEAGASLAFSIQPHWWQRLWLRIAAAAGLMLGGGGGAWWIMQARQRQRRQADERFRGVVEAAPSAMVVVRRDGTIALANAQTERSFGYTRQELIGRPIEMLLPARLAANHPALREGFFNEPAARAMGPGRDLIGRRRDGGEFPIEVGLTPMATPEGVLVLASIVDISDRKRAELELARQRNELAHLSRVNMLGELSGSLAHELNQPLASILSNAQAAQRFLARDDADLDEVRDILKDIVDEDKRAGEVIRRLRLLLKKGEVQRQPLHVNEVVLDVLRLVRSDLINQGVSAALDLSPALPAVAGDRVQLQQVLLNLVMNACDAMAEVAKPDRRLRIAAAVLSRAQMRALAGTPGAPGAPGAAESAGDAGAMGIHLSVQDRGVGIPADRLPHIFEPFHSTKASGMGLGLTVCRTIIAAHGGRLWATNNPDGGATLHVWIPASP